MTTFIKLSSLLASVILFTASCSEPNTSTYQKQVNIPATKWDYRYTPTFEFEVTDTSAHYNAFLIFRYDEAFEFSNIWLRLKTQKPTDTSFNEGKRLEAVLIAHDGSRLGNNIGGMYEYKIQLDPKTDFEPFTEKGTYKIKLEQIMRKNPLVGLINVGLRIERHDTK